MAFPSFTAISICLTTSMSERASKQRLNDNSTIGSTAEWGERTRHERTSGNENQPGDDGRGSELGRRTLP